MYLDKHICLNKSLPFFLAGILFNLLMTDVYALNFAAYAFNYEPDKTPGCVQVLLVTKTDADGNAVLRLPDNVDVFYIQNPGAKFSTISKSLKIVSVQFKPDEQVAIRYESCFSNPSETIKEALYSKNILYFAHDRMLILPLGKSAEEEWRYMMDFSRIPENFNIVSSYPIKNKKMDMVASLGEFKRTATMAGDFTPTVLTFDEKEDKPINYIQTGNWDWLKETPEFYIRKLLTYQRRFWQDDNASDYTISFSTQKETPYCYGVKGTHFKNFMTFSINPNKDHLHASIIAISHELFHGWIGDKAAFKAPIEPLTWFIEGFTDYYGARFALETEVISFSEYIDYLNNHLLNFYSSPIRSMTRDQALANYDPDNHVYLFESIKGTLVAHKMAKLKDENNDRIIDKTMKGIYAKIKENKKLSEKEQKSIVWEQFNQALGKEQWAEYEKLLNAQTHELSENDFDFPAKIKMKSFKIPHYHFDMNHFICKREIKDLSEHSPEYKAGLRNGMKVVQNNLLFHKPIEEVIIVTNDENNVSKTIKFKPKLKKLKIPQLILP